jgi:RNA polymerase sigma-70 factor (ECF subfamily)
MRQRSNSEWLLALRAGDQNQAVALAELRELVLGAILKFLSRNETPGGSSLGHDLHQMAEDCAQETVILIQSKLEQFRGESKFTTWAYSIAVRVTLGELRRRRWQKAAVVRAHLGEDMPVWPTDAPEPERSLERQQAWALLARLIENSLTPLQRKALVAHAFQGMPLDLVAEWLGGNRNSVYKLIHDARKRLKAALLSEGVTHQDIIATFDSPRRKTYLSDDGKIFPSQSVSNTVESGSSE